MRDELILPETANIAYKKGCKLERCTCGGYPECICKNRSLITQSLLQRWLRKTHNFDFIIMPTGNSSGETIGYYYEIIVDDYNKDNIESDSFDTYEDATEAALIETLSLIK